MPPYGGILLEQLSPPVENQISHIKLKPSPAAQRLFSVCGRDFGLAAAARNGPRFSLRIPACAIPLAVTCFESPPGVLGPFNPPQHALKLFTVESRRGFDSLLPGFKGPFTEPPCFCSLGLGERKRTASGFNPP